MTYHLMNVKCAVFLHGQDRVLDKTMCSISNVSGGDFVK